jgi:hypothetical protein
MVQQRGPVVVDEVNEEALDVGAILILSAEDHKTSSSQ